MQGLIVRSAAVAVLGFAIISFASPRTGAAADDKITSIKDIMAKAHKGGDSLLSAMKADLAKKDVNWDAVQSKSKDLVLLAGDLSKNKPGKGEQASWDKLTAAYGEDAKKLHDAADKKDVPGASKALASLGKSCGACHKAHK